jgi:hypothetical protein
MEVIMRVVDSDTDATAALIERRWFASLSAVRAMQDECEMLREVMEMAESAWRRARAQLAWFESLRDALGEELAEREGRHEELVRTAADRRISTAA